LPHEDLLFLAADEHGDLAAVLHRLIRRLAARRRHRLSGLDGRCRLNAVAASGCGFGRGRRGGYGRDLGGRGSGRRALGRRGVRRSLGVSVGGTTAGCDGSAVPVALGASSGAGGAVSAALTSSAGLAVSSASIVWVGGAGWAACAGCAVVDSAGRSAVMSAVG